MQCRYYPYRTYAKHGKSPLIYANLFKFVKIGVD